jgi:hypothetical protein
MVYDSGLQSPPTLLVAPRTDYVPQFDCFNSSYPPCVHRSSSDTALWNILGTALSVLTAPFGSRIPGNDDFKVQMRNYPGRIGRLQMHANPNKGQSDRLHVGISCAGCSQSPIKGVRYECSICDNYNLCSSCEDQNVETLHHSADHPLLKLRTPMKQVHTGVSCTSCGVSPIRGVRYNCQVCIDYNMCEECEAENQHPPTHALFKVKQPR